MGFGFLRVGLFISIFLFQVSSQSLANSSRDFRTGQINFRDVFVRILEKYDGTTDDAVLYQKAWQKVEQILPSTDFIPAGTIAVSGFVGTSSDTIRDFYADRIEETIKKVAYTLPDEATPSVRKLWNEATRGLVWALNDPYSQFLPAEEHKELQRVLSGEPDEKSQFYGVGISVDWDTESDEGVLVISPLPGTPAERNGIRAGDVIVAVNGEFLKHWEGMPKDKLDQAVKKIKGEKGTEVTLTIRRPGTPELLDFNLTREPINPDLHITKEMLNDEIGYIHLYSFYAHAQDDVLQALRFLHQQGMKKIIFDLRYNPGGYLDQAVRIADLFLKKDDLITYTQGRASKPRYFHKKSYSTPDNYSEIPMVILMNEFSASASEVVTGALKDNKRAIVVGKTSFGKGSVQEVFNLHGGAGLRLTVAKYYTPSGVCIHGKGIRPDIEVDPVTEDEWKEIQKKDYHNVSRLDRLLERDPQLKMALQYLQGEISLANTDIPSSSDDG